MPRPRIPNAKAAVTGADRINPGRFAGRKAPRARPLGEPPETFDDARRAIWFELADMAPWLKHHDRIAVEMTARLIYRMRTEPEFGVSATQALSALLSKLGLTPTDVTKVPHDEDDAGDPDDRFFDRPN